MIIFQQRIE